MSYKASIYVSTLIVLFIDTNIGTQGISLLEEDVRLTRIRRQDNDCGVHDFHCGNTTTCIEQYHVCDGVVDCEDGSDESNSCKRLRCPPYAFRCDYGGCINTDLVCNGRDDCRDGSDESQKNCNTDRQNAGNCTTLEFKCDSGQCIDVAGKCDGKYSCLDKSDETRETCQSTNCPPYAFRCDYGGCINMNKRCNGVIDCVDESDEDPKICGTPVRPTPTPEPEPPVVPQTPSSCEVPEAPDHGKLVNYINAESLVVPGTYLPESTLLIEQCNKGFLNVGSLQYIVCNRGHWSRGIGTCVPTCSPLVNTTKTIITCSKNNLPVSCQEAIGGTKAVYKCAPFYEDLNAKRREAYRICRDGKWDQFTPVCLPECGIKRAPPRVLVVGGGIATKGDYPWQVALYVNRGGNVTLICGGVLISEKVALTAAHCVAEDDGTPRPNEWFTIAVGKYYNAINDPNDPDAQFSDVSSIHVPPEYRSEDSKYLGDIAILIVKKPFHLTHRVLPVCVDWGTEYDLQLNENGTMGIVTGWGLTEPGGLQANEMREIIVPYIPTGDCKSALPWDYVKYLTADKMCSGFTNKSKGVCEGDSGSPLVFLNNEDKRYYVRGLVSLSPQLDNSCDTNFYALYTMIKYHLRFISDTVY